ncbi:MAG: LysR family transcriptional regulator, partial [Cognatishimia sp.]
MDLKKLKYFLCVAEEGGFSAASRKLHVAQPAISGHVAALEQELGVSLFDRSNRGVVPTTHGRRLRDHARHILWQLEAAANDVRDGSNDPGGEVAIAVPVTAARLLTGPILRRMEEEYPRIKLKVFEGLSHESGHIISSGMVDFAVIPNASDIENVTAEPLFHEHMYLIGKRRTDLPAVSEIPFKDLAKYPLTTGDKGWNARRAIELAALQNEVKISYGPEVTGIESMFSVVREGQYFSITNWAAIHSCWDLDQGFAYRIVAPSLQRTI